MDLSSYIEGWRVRERVKVEAVRARALEARRRLPAVVAILSERFHATRVVLFGSLADGRFDEASDVDLAVEGLDSRFFVAWEAAQQDMGDEFRLDIVPSEHAAGWVCRAIARGEVLYEGR